MICMPERRSVTTNSQFLTPRINTEITVQSDLLTEQKRNTPGPAHECSREVYPQTEDLCDVSDTYPDMEADVGTNSEQPNKSPTKPQQFQKQFTS